MAREMEHVAAPRPGGALAAIEAAPDADVVFVGHVGIAAGMAGTWRLLGARRSVRLRLWLVAAGEIPVGEDARIDWLFARWQTLDRWVDAQQPSSDAVGGP